MTLVFVGAHVDMASDQERKAGLWAAEQVFQHHGVSPEVCAAAHGKLLGDELLTREEAQWCLVWEEAEDQAVYAMTLGWLSRDVDIHLALV